MAKVNGLQLPPLIDTLIADRQREVLRITGEMPTKQKVIVEMLAENSENIRAKTQKLRDQRIKI